MSEPRRRCVVCGVHLPPEQTVYEDRHFLDPIPPAGYACSERCACVIGVTAARRP